MCLAALVVSCESSPAWQASKRCQVRAHRVFRSVFFFFLVNWLEDILSCIRKHASSFHQLSLWHKVFSFYYWENENQKFLAERSLAPRCPREAELHNMNGTRRPVWCFSRLCSVLTQIFLCPFNRAALRNLTWTEKLPSGRKKNEKNQQEDRGEKKTVFCFDLILCPGNTVRTLSPPHFLVAKQPLLPVTVVLV